MKLSKTVLVSIGILFVLGLVAANVLSSRNGNGFARNGSTAVYYGS